MLRRERGTQFRWHGGCQKKRAGQGVLLFCGEDRPNKKLISWVRSLGKKVKGGNKGVNHSGG